MVKPKYKNEPDNGVFAKNTLLCDLARKYHADKVRFGYTRVYDYYFSSLKKDAKKIFEIGARGGNSLRMWKDYFENASIYGMDIKDCGKVNDERIHTLIGDQGKKDDLKQLVVRPEDGYSVIVDDGSHMQDDLLTSFGVLFKCVAPGGYYIMEDVWSLVEANGKRKPQMQWGVKCKDFSDSVTTVMENFKVEGMLESEHINYSAAQSIKRKVEFIHIFYAYKYPLTKQGTSNLVIIKKKD